MPVREVTAAFEGHHIVVRNAWVLSLTPILVRTTMTLSVDGGVVASSSQSYSVSARAPLLRATVQMGDHDRVVEVFCRAIFRTRIKICVDGEKVAGDLE